MARTDSGIDLEIQDDVTSLPRLLGRSNADTETVGKEVPPPEAEAEGKSHPKETGVEDKKYGYGVIFRNSSAREKRAALVAFVLIFLAGCSVPVTALLSSRCMTVLSTTEPSRVLEKMTNLIIALGVNMLVSFLLASVSQGIMLWVGGKLMVRLRKSYLEALVSQDMAWLDQHDAASLPTRMEKELTDIQILISQHLAEYVANMAQFLFGIILAFLLGWKLTLVLCASAPLLIFAGACIAKALHALNESWTSSFGKAGAVAEEALLAIRTVAAFGAERKETARFEEQLKPARRAGIKSGMQVGAAIGFQQACFCGLYGLAFWFGSHYMILDEGADSGVVITVLLCLVIGLSGLTTASAAFSNVVAGKAAAEAIQRVIDGKMRQTEPVLGSLDGELPDSVKSFATLEFKYVRFSYPSRPDVPILYNLSLKVLQGQKVGIVGESGCGKSTIIQLLERFYDPSSGEILINGHPLAQLPVKAWRRQIGYVGQEPVLFAASVLDNIKAGDSSISDAAAQDAARSAQALDFLQTLPEELHTYVGRGGSQMSGGQKQRIAIARALVREPQILLLDEATSALDSESEKMVQETIDSLHSSTGAGLTTLSIAHRLSTIMNSDTIFVMKSGRLCENGSHDELMQLKGTYYDLVCSQQGRSDSHGNGMTPKEVWSNRTFGSTASSSNSFTRSGTALSLQSHVSDGVFGLNAEAHAYRTKLAKVARPYWGVYPFAFLSVLFAAIVVPVQAGMFNMAIASLFIRPLGDMYEAVDFWSLALSVLAVVSFISEWLKTSIFSYLQESIIMRLRATAFTALIRREIAFFDDAENNAAGLMSVLERHMTQVAATMGHNLANSCAAIMVCVASVVFGFFGSWQLALCLVGIMPTLLAICGMTAILSHRPIPAAEEMLRSAAEISADALIHVRTLRSLVNEQYVTEAVEHHMEEWRKVDASTVPCKAFTLGLATVAVHMILFSSYWISTVLLHYGYSSAPQVLLTLLCVVFGGMYVSVVARFIPDAATGRMAAQEVFRIIDQPSKVDALDPEGQHCSLGDGSIEFRDVHFSYPTRAQHKILNGFCLRVKPGSAVALVGPSGCGKSTVIQLLQRFYDPDLGSVKIGGVNLRQFNVAWWRRQLGFVGQEPVLFNMTLEENISYGCDGATLEQMESAARAANMDFVFDGQVGWHDMLGFKGEKLSGGQKQRCAIARAVLRNPSILLLDEATSALDSASEQLVQQALTNLCATRTSFTVAHRLSTIRDCNPILVLADGKVSKQVTYEELLASQPQGQS